MTPRRAAAAASALSLAASVAIARADEPVSLVERPIVLSYGEAIASVDGAIGRADLLTSLTTQASFELDGRVGVASSLELDVHVPFAWDGTSVNFAGPGLGARYEVYDRAFELALRVDVGGSGIAGYSADGVGVTVAQGFDAARAFGTRFRLEIEALQTAALDREPTLGLSFPVLALAAVNKTFFVSVSSGYSRYDVRTSTTSAIPVELTLTQVVERHGDPLFDIGAFVRRPNLILYPDVPYVIFSAGLDVALHFKL